MNKTLYIVRHGKAEEHTVHKRDYDRNLIDAGVERNRNTANALSKHRSQTDKKTLFISSSANRAIQTAEIFADLLGYPKNKIEQSPNIYEAYFLDILKVLNSVSKDYDTVFIFGHNPGLSDLVYYLTNQQVELRTSNTANIELENDLDFSELSKNTSHLIQVFDY